MKLVKIIGAAVTALFLTMGFCSAASAAEFYFGDARVVEDGTVTNTTAKTAAKDETVAIPVNIKLEANETDNGIGALELKISYDGDVLEPVKNSSGKYAETSSYYSFEYLLTNSLPASGENDPYVKVTAGTTATSGTITEGEVIYLFFKSSQSNVNVKDNLTLEVEDFSDLSTNVQNIKLGTDVIDLVIGKSTDIAFTIAKNPTFGEDISIPENAAVKSVWAHFSNPIRENETAERTTNYVQLGACSLDDEGNAKFSINVENLALDHTVSPETDIKIYVELSDTDSATGGTSVTINGESKTLFEIPDTAISNISVNSSTSESLAKIIF